VSEPYDDFYDDSDECDECGGEGGYNSCPEDCCPHIYGEDGLRRPGLLAALLCLPRNRVPRGPPMTFPNTFRQADPP
jgi:hypothetical protein